MWRLEAFPPLPLNRKSTNPKNAKVIHHMKVEEAVKNQAKDDLAAISVVSLHEYQQNCRLQFLIWLFVSPGEAKMYKSATPTNPILRSYAERRPEIKNCKRQFQKFTWNKYY